MAKKLAFLAVAFALFIGGCVPPYQPNVDDNKKTDEPTVVKPVSPRAAFENYRLDVAKDMRQLAQDCIDGRFEYVSELVDASVSLDEVAKGKRVKPIDTIFATELGSDELDKEKAAKVLLRVADDLDPDHKIELIYPEEDEPEPAPTPPPKKVKRPASGSTEQASQIPSEPLRIDYLPEQKPAVKVTSKTRLATGLELLAQCRTDVQKYDIAGSVHHHLYQHGFTPEQVKGLNRHQLYLLHDNVHAGVIHPQGVK